MIPLALLDPDAATFPSQEFGQVTSKERLSQAPSVYPNTGAVSIFDKGFVVTEIKGVEFHRHTRIKIIDESGIAKVTSARSTRSNSTEHHLTVSFSPPTRL